MAWYHPSTPDNIKPVPWLHPAAVAYLETLITKDSVVYEHGCGGSSLWLAERARSVISFEPDTEWAQKMRDMGCNVEDSSFPPIDWPQCDLLFIDGQSNARITWIEASPRLVKPGGWVVLDNANRSQYAQAIYNLMPFTDERMAVICHIPEIDKTVSTQFFRIKP